MSLSDIKFDYLDKIENINKRIDRYSEIIDDYDDIITVAKNEENPNISSVLNSKSSYEKKIKHLINVKEYYQEFVETSDYLLQNLNKEQTHLLISQNQELLRSNDNLKKDMQYLEQLLSDKEEDLKNLKIRNDLDKIKIKDLRKKYNDKINSITIKNAASLKKLRDENKSLKKLKKDVRRLSAQLQMEIDTKDFLESENVKLNEKISNLEKEIAPYRKLKHSDKYLVEYYNIKKENRSLKMEVKSVNEKISILDETIKKKNRELQILHERLNWQPKSNKIIEEKEE